MVTRDSKQLAREGKETCQIAKPEAKQKVSPLRKRMIRDMELAGYTGGTQQTYIGAVVKLQDHYNIRPDRLSEKQVQQYILWLRDEKDVANPTYLIAGLFAYNLVRELQMQTTKPLRCTTAKRASLWIFEKVDTLRKTLIQRAGRLTRPKGTLTLTISANRWIKRRLLNVLGAIPPSV